MDVVTLHHAAMQARAGGRMDQAVTLMQQAVSLREDDPVLQNNLANLLNECGRPGLAIEAYRHAVRLAPTYVVARYNLACLLRDCGDLAGAESEFREVVAHSPEDVPAWNALGSLLGAEGRLTEAEQCFERALALAPAKAEAMVNTGAVALHRGDMEGAAAWFERALAAEPGYLKTYENLARVRRYGVADLPYIERIEAMARGEVVDAATRAELHFALGKMLDDCGEYERAFAHFSRANRLRHRPGAYSRSAIESYVATMIRVCDGGWFEPPPTTSSSAGVNVFMVGMMRSGTTLAEQVLASHPKVLGAGELTSLGRLAVALTAGGETYPASLAHASGAEFERIGREYRGSLPALPPGATHVLDKMTYNFLHLGLIARALPGARLVHCTRDAVDVCLSIYFQSFMPGHWYAYDLADIAHYHGQYQRLMQHWCRSLPERPHEHEYEAMIEQPEPVIRSLLEYCRLPWSEQCLDHTANRRAVSTASNWQVRQPLYHRAVRRWRNYERHLQPLLQALGR